MLHYGQVFDNVFERRGSKCCGVLMKHTKLKVYNRSLESDSYDENDVKQKVNDLVRLHKAM